VYWGYRQAAVVVAATTMVLVGLKQPLHAWTRHFTAEDIRGTLQFRSHPPASFCRSCPTRLRPYGAFTPTRPG